MLDKKWLWQDVDQGKLEQLTKKYNISKLIAEIIIKRGIHEEDIPAFLDPSLDNLHSPFEIKGMDEAVDRIKNAIENKEKILIFGDYDVDGITSTTVLYTALKELGANVINYIPNRTEGYGLNIPALENSFKEGVSLVVTVDCGISAVEEVNFCVENSVDCIVTDHHTPPELLPKAFTIINPKQKGCDYKFKELAGVGLAFKLVTALYVRSGRNDWDKYLDIVALGTVADLVPLLGENRTIVALGLKYMNKNLRLPLAKLGEVAGIKPPIDSYHLGFIFGPRLNAAGRLESPKEALDLLLSTDVDMALELAKFLNEQNKERQEIEQKIVEECISIVEKINLNNTKVLVLAKEGWHHGVIGIVASRIVEKFHRPVICLSIKGETATGSCRSIEGFNMYNALNDCEDLLVKYGGHAMAAGLTIETDTIQEFTNKINNYAVDNDIEKYLTPKITVDMNLNPKELDLALISDINRLRPFGQMNPAPVFRIEQLRVSQFSLVGQQKNHLKVDFQVDHMWISSIGFKKADLISKIYGKDIVSFVGYLDENTFNGSTKLQLKIVDLKDEKEVTALEKQGPRILDIRKSPLKTYFQKANNLSKNYIVFVNKYHKNKLEDFYLTLPNVIIKEYGENYTISNRDIPVFMSIPFRQYHFVETFHKFKEFGISEMILAFNDEETELVPKREFLVNIYQTIKKLSSMGKETTQEIIKSEINGKFSVDYLIDRGLNIFSESNLVYNKNNCWFLNDVQEKIDFTSGEQYKKYSKQHEIFRRWHDFALVADLNELISGQQFKLEEEQIWI